MWAGGKGQNEWGVAGWAGWDGTRTNIEELAVRKLQCIPVPVSGHFIFLLNDNFGMCFWDNQLFCRNIECIYSQNEKRAGANE